MITGLGIDIVDLDRMRKSLDQYDGLFSRKIFTDAEIAYCDSKAFPAQHYAARFAAKEALSKAISTGWSGPFQWKDAEVVNEPSGAPRLKLHGPTAALLEGCRVHLSLSHTDTTVAAVVVIEKE